MAKYRRDYSQEEAELEELEKQGKTPPENDEEEEVSGEELTFKKRYSDLRSHAQKKQNEYEDRIKALEAAVTAASSKQMELPDVSSKEEAEKWIQKYPELAKVFRYLALEQDTKVKEEVTKTRETVQEMKYQVEKQKAYARLLELQPDFEKVANDPKFVDWLLTKSKRMQDAMWVHIDPDDASDVIDVYKMQVLSQEKNTPANKKKEAARAAERVVRPTSGAAPNDGAGDVQFSESYVEIMSARDKGWFDKNEAAIMEAIRKGKFEYDLTGAAR